MLKISGDGRRAALDLRLLGLPQTTPGKITAAADRITAIWTAHQDDEYFDPGGIPYPVRGSLQLVFCDLGTPGPGWNAYDELRDQLVARDVPYEAIHFIHEAKTDRDKAKLFAASRAGRVAVLIGSTEKMGVGTNVQDRAIALHHLDASWRPADVAQRDGRILRAAGGLAPAIRAATWQTLIGLLAVTGMRQGEACRLGRGDADLDAGTLVIADSKFGKSRLVFLHPTTAATLRAYEKARDEAFPEPETDALLVNSRGGPLDRHNVPRTFAALVTAAGIQAPPGQRAPRLHDLRHAFTVATMLDWYREAGTCRPGSRCCRPGSATWTRRACRDRRLQRTTHYGSRETLRPAARGLASAP